MPPKKSTTSNQTTRTNSRKRLSSPTEETLENSTNSDDETQNQTPNDDDQTNSSSNSDQSEDQAKDNAKDEDTKAEKKPVKESEERKRAGSEPKGHIIRVGEDLHIPATKHDSFAVVDKDVYKEIILRGSNRVSYQLVYTAGTAIPLSKLDQIQ